MENVLNKFSKKTQILLHETGVRHVSYNGENKLMGFLSSGIIPVYIQKITKEEAIIFESKDKISLSTIEYNKIYIPDNK